MDQVSRPMQIALVAVVLLAGMWFTVLKPKPAAAPATATPAAVTPAPASSEPVAPGVKGLTSAVEKAKGASAAADATNAKIQKATGASPAAAKPAATKAAPAASKAKRTAPAKAKTTAAVKTGTKAPAPAAAKAKPAAATATATKKPVDVDPSDRLLSFLNKGKTLVILFHGAGADDRGARKAVHRTAKADPKHVTSAYIPIGDVGKYEAITSDVQILAAPSILVIGTDGKATLLTGYVDAAVVRETVSDARRAAAKSSK